MSARMTRKQIYVDAERQAKLRRTAETLGVSEAEVVRRAIDEIAERCASPREILRERLRAVGLLVELPDDEPRLTPEELAEDDRILREWARTNPPIGIDRLIDEDRGEW